MHDGLGNFKASNSVLYVSNQLTFLDFCNIMEMIETKTSMETVSCKERFQ